MTKSSSESNEEPNKNQLQDDSEMQGLASESSVDESSSFAELLNSDSLQNRSYDNSPFALGNEYPDIEGFIVLSQIGVGAYGEVYKVKKVSENSLYALKILKPHHLRDQAAIARFHQEISIFHRVAQTGVVHVVASSNCTKGVFVNCPYLVMEYFEKGSLKEWIKENPRCDRTVLRNAVQFLESACNGIAVLHSKKTVHRDIKPGNILLEDSGTAKIADFGMARLVSEDHGLSISQGSNVPIGTLCYAAPEQLNNPGNPLLQSDIYSLGVVLWEILHGLRPWQEVRDDFGEERQRIERNCLSPSLPSRKVGLDSTLLEIALCCLDPKPELRFESVEKFQQAIQLWLRDEPVSLPSRLRRTWNANVLGLFRKKPYLSQAAVAAITIPLLSLATVGIYLLAFVWPVAYLYKGFTGWEGIPRPLGRSLEATEVSRYAYQAFYRGYFGPLIEIRLVDRNGNPLDRAPLDKEPLSMLQNDESLLIDHQVIPIDIFRDHPVHWRYRYHDDGQLWKIEELDSRSQVLQTRLFDGLSSARYEESPIGFLFSLEGISPKTRPSTQIHRLRFEWSNGFCSRVQFLDSLGKPTRDEEGAFGWRYQRNELGEVVEKECLTYGRLGESVGVTASGYSKLVIQNPTERKRRYRFLDKNGELVLDKRFGAEEIEFSLDTSDRVQGITFFVNGREVKGPFGGPFIKLDWTNQQVEVMHFTERTGQGNSQPYEIIRGTFSSTGLLTRVESLDGKREAGSYRDSLFSSLQLDYRDNNLSSLTLLNRAGQPSAEQTGASQLRFSWSKDGRPTGMEMFHLDKPVISLLGYHQTKLKENDSSGIFSLSFFGLNEKAVKGPNGHHRSEIHYDRQGNVLRQEFFDTAGNRTISQEKKYHRIEFTYDPLGNTTSWAVFGRDNERIIDAEQGVHRVEMRYDEEGHLIEYSLFGDDNLPMLDPEEGCHLVKRHWKEGEIVSVSYYGLKEEKVLSQSKGCHEIRIDKNLSNHSTSYSYFGINREPVMSRVDGVHKEVETTNIDGVVLRVENFDTENHPTNSSKGWHLRERENSTMDFIYYDASKKLLVPVIISKKLFSKDKKKALLEDEDWIRVIQNDVVDTKVADQFFYELSAKSDGNLGSILSGVGLLGSDTKEFELIIQRGDSIKKIELRRSLLKQADLRLQWVTSDSLLDLSKQSVN